jgi:flagellar biosynthesis/type III secretory pathway chaperone
MKKIEQLAQVLAMEAELAENLIDVMGQKQQAIVNMLSDQLADAVQREEQLLVPLAELEQERLKILRNMKGISTDVALAKHKSDISLDALMNALNSDDAFRIADRATRLRSAIYKIFKMNEQNKILLSHSRRFVKETLRIITDNYKRQLVDQKI